MLQQNDSSAFSLYVPTDFAFICSEQWSSICLWVCVQPWARTVLEFELFLESSFMHADNYGYRKYYYRKCQAENCMFWFSNGLNSEI